MLTHADLPVTDCVSPHTFFLNADVPCLILVGFMVFELRMITKQGAFSRKIQGIFNVDLLLG